MHIDKDDRNVLYTYLYVFESFVKFFTASFLCCYNQLNVNIIYYAFAQYFALKFRFQMM